MVPRGVSREYHGGRLSFPSESRAWGSATTAPPRKAQRGYARTGAGRDAGREGGGLPLPLRNLCDRDGTLRTSGRSRAQDALRARRRDRAHLLRLERRRSRGHRSSQLGRRCALYPTPDRSLHAGTLSGRAANDIVGERGPLEGNARSATVRATSHMLTFAISRKRLLELAENNPKAREGMFAYLRERYSD